MIIYLIVFSLSSFLFYISQKTNGITSKLLAIIGILLPSILAGCRAYNIGTDVRVYGQPYYDIARNSNNLSELLKVMSLRDNKDIGFITLMFILSRWFEDYHWGLFVYQLITISFIYLGMKRYYKYFKTPIWLSMLLYYFLCYNLSLNAMRQMIAVSIVFYATTYLLEKKYKIFLIFIFLSILFHTSGMLGLIFLPMYIYLKEKDNKNIKNQILRGTIFIIGVLIGLSAIDSIILKLVNYGIVRNNYLNYLKGGSIANFGLKTINWASVLPTLLFILFGISNYKIMNNKHMQSLFFIVNSFLLLIGYCIGSLSRISYYFLPLQIIMISNMQLCYKRKTQNVWNSIVIMLLFAQWYYQIVLMKGNQTIPYRFFWN